MTNANAAGINGPTLEVLAFKSVLYNGQSRNVPQRVRHELWRRLLCDEFTDTHLQLYLHETNHLGEVLKLLFDRRSFDMTTTTTTPLITTLIYHHANAVTRFHEFINKNLTDLTPHETLQFVLVYLYLNDSKESFLPERFAVWWLKSDKNKCKWCSSSDDDDDDDDVFYVSSEKFFYTTVCCGKLKLSYHDHYEPQPLTDIVSDLKSYCVVCHRPLYIIKDMESYNFPKELYLCTLC
ncbi:hypothetical protein [Alphabaculovirus myunipunctae]|uniref:Uncharacterized protein n=1 Tax=Mythimna unipuncta nucleopolyhedrovirus TaxID=447897 RepID=A0A2K9VSC4_9ABAC|nr:hypothetical protein [Mythimna unipuncta nucleopolyhedrovirus]AUV65371.1 hypothetical protein [Mythimna unipuncta nucleopolyhedrovirus]